MILNQDKTTAEITGEIQNNRVGIDANNINFITNLLTSNLYSYPIESFLRETVANAWDSQVEAGNVNTPILIKINQVDKDDEDLTISIRDYGVGLSPERFDTIYKNIGSSTKRASNNYIGCLGIGRFSCLAVSNTVSIRSYYQGKCYSYLMYKDGETLNIDLLNTIDTQYDNGVEVSVTIKDAYYERNHIIKGLALLSYFEQIYVDNNAEYLKDFVERFNKRTIHEFNSFKVCSLPEVSGMHFLMGDVLYPCTDNNYLHFENNPCVAITLGIGDVDVTPNREQLRFSDKTKTALDAKVKAFDDEIYQLCDNIMVGDFPTITAWHRQMNQDEFIVKLWNFDGYTPFINVTKDSLLKHNIKDKCTIRSRAIPHRLMDYYNFVKNMQFPNTFLSYNYTNKQFCRPDKTSVKTYLEYNYELCYLNEPYKPITKQYIRTFGSGKHTYYIRKDQLTPVYKMLLRDFARWFKNWNTAKVEHLSFPKDALTLIIEEIRDVFNNIPTFNNWDVPKEWIQEQKEAKTKAQRRDCVIYQLCWGRARDTVSTTTEHGLEYFLNYKGTVVYAEKGDEDLEFMFRTIDKLPGKSVAFISVAKSNMSIIQKVKRFVFIDDFMYENKYLQMAFTGKYIREIKAQIYNDTLMFDDEHRKIVRRINSCLEADNKIYSGDKINALYKHYKDTHQLYYSIIQDATNPNIQAIDKFTTKLQINYSLDKSKTIAFMYFVYKNNIRVGKVNRITAFKYLQEHCAI